MRCNSDICIAGAASWLPEPGPVAPAVSQGLVDQMHSNLGYESVTVSDGVAAPDMAIRAARAALAQSNIQQQSCGGMGGLHLAIAYLTSGFASSVMVTTGDAFAAPAFDRWNSQTFTLFGDAGTALALSTRHGFAQVLAIAAFADNSLEGWGRGSEPFVFAPATQTPIPVLRRALPFIHRGGGLSENYDTARNHGSAVAVGQPHGRNRGGLGCPSAVS